MSNLLVINGPNLNLLGKREPEIYGSKTLDQIANETESRLSSQKLQLTWFQSNSESEIVEKIHECVAGSFDGIVINPGAFSHTSISILDALNAVKVPKVEVHISHTNLREEFRQKKVTAKGADGICEGFGDSAYYIGILSILELINKRK